MNGPELKCYGGYSVTRCHSTDEMINSSNASHNSDNTLVISKEGYTGRSVLSKQDSHL